MSCCFLSTINYECNFSRRFATHFYKSGFSSLQYQQKSFYGANNVNLFAEVKIGAGLWENSEIVFVLLSIVSTRNFSVVLGKWLLEMDGVGKGGNGTD
jgi:hypothetical protein